jgi:RIO1 family
VTCLRFDRGHVHTYAHTSEHQALILTTNNDIKREMSTTSGSEATLLEVLDIWAWQDATKFNCIRGMFPVVTKLLVKDVCLEGESLGILERFLESRTLDETEKLYCDIFIATCRVWSKPGFVRPNSVGAGIQLFNSDISPSDYAKAWNETQKNLPTAIMCLRPPHCSWVNIRIMHPVFNNVAKAIMSGVPLPRDFVLAKRLAHVLSPQYPIESKRRDAGNKVLNEFLFRDVLNRELQVTGIDEYSTDGSAPEFGVTVEYKNEKAAGNGSDPYMQNVAYYGKYWASRAKEGATHGLKKHCCPWLLIEVLGQEVGISGAAYACGRICAQPISANVPFLDVPCDKDMALVQARLCMALRIGVTQLRAFYENEVPLLTVTPQAHYPYPRQARLDGTDKDLVEFQYTSVWGGVQQRKMLFTAERSDTNERIMVKFSGSYDPDVHRALAAQGLAPKLYDIQYDTGLTMIIMEYLEDARAWTDQDQADPAKTKQLRAIQDVLAKNGFVHGDLRPPNILVDQYCKVYVVDFDWAGKAGAVRYPVYLNPDGNWHPEAKLGECIQQHHDEFLVDVLLGEKKRKSDHVAGEELE